MGDMLKRVPEQEIVMESTDSVEAFDWAGSDDGPLVPIYAFNARRLSRLLPTGSRVLDLACGPGRFLAHFLSGRPDISAVGLDLSASMLELAEKNLAAAGLDGRFSLIQSDWTKAYETVEGPIDAVTCISALHHSPTTDDLVAALASTAAIQRHHDAAVWLFDLVRPEADDLVEAIPRLHEMTTGNALPAAFKADWVNSLRAGWTLAEFIDAAAAARLRVTSQEANYSQLHWSAGSKPPPGEHDLWDGPALRPSTEARAAGLEQSFS